MIQQPAFKRMPPLAAAIMLLSSGSAFNTLYDLGISAFSRASNFFFSEQDGVARALEPTMRQSGLLNLQTQIHQLEYQGGTPEGQLFAEDMKHVFHTVLPFLRKWTQVPSDQERLVRKYEVSS